MRKLLLTILIAVPTFAQLPTATELPLPRWQPLDNNGRPVAGGKLCTYASGTFSPLPTYTTQAGNIQLPNPIILDSAGRAAVFFGGGQIYRVVFQQPGNNFCPGTGATIWTQDGVTDVGELLAQQLATTAGAGLIGYSQTAVYPAGTVGSGLQGQISVKDAPYNATGNGTTNDTAAIAAAFQNACTATVPVEIIFPIGTYLIQPVAPLTRAPIIPICSNLTVRGPGTVKIANSAGSYYAIFSPASGTVSNFNLSGLTVDMNSSNNPLVSSGDLGTYPRMVLQTGPGGGSGNNCGNDSVEGVTVTNIRSEWVFFGTCPGTIFKGNWLINVGGGTVASDSSLLYIERGATGSKVQGNFIQASAPAANLAGTAIEVQDRADVTANTIDGMLAGMNMVGAASATVSGDTATGNIITRAYGGIHLWSSNGSGAVGCGLNRALVANNTIGISQLLYTATGGAMSGIVLDPNANLPFCGIKVSENIVYFDLSASSMEPINNASMGIGYWDATNSNVCQDCDFSNNKVFQAPGTAYQYAAGGGNIHFDNDIAINAGSSKGSVGAPFLSCFFLGNAVLLTGPLTVRGGDCTDNLSPSRLNYGVALESAVGPNDIAVTMPVTCAAPCASMDAAYLADLPAKIASFNVRVNVPNSVHLPIGYANPGSSVYDINNQITYLWDGFTWNFTYPHPTAPVVSSCGTSSGSATNDRVSYIIVGGGSVTSCTVKFGTSFTVQPVINFSVIANPSAGTGIYPATPLYAVLSGTYTSGVTATGSTGQTCTLTATGGLIATVALTGTNTIAGSSPLVITGPYPGANGGSYAAASGPTSATATNGTATCSGTATIATTLNTAYTGGFIVTGTNFSGANFSWSIPINEN